MLIATIVGLNSYQNCRWFNLCWKPNRQGIPNSVYHFSIQGR